MYMNMSAAEIIAILSGISGLLVGLIAAISGARKDEVSLLRQTLEDVVKENGRLRARMQELEVCVRDSESTIRTLTDQVEEWKDKYTKLQSEFDLFKRSRR